MMLSQRSLRTLDVISGLALLIAATLYLWPVHATVRAAPMVPEPAVAVAESGRMSGENDVAVVVSSNILSSGRHTPSTRYVSPDLMPAPDYSMPAAFAASANADSAKAATQDPDAVPSLYGIVNSDGTWRALLRLDEADPSPMLLREGDRRGTYRVMSIRSNAVVVAGPSGQRTLRLTPVPRNDSTGKSL